MFPIQSARSVFGWYALLGREPCAGPWPVTILLRRHRRWGD